MPYAVHLFFDPYTEKIIRSAWKKLADSNISPYMSQSDNRPHFSLAIYQTIDLKACEQKLQSFASTCYQMSVSLEYLGIFPTDPAVVFLSAPISSSLIDLHAKVHELLQPISSDAASYYLPGNWVPHCTLAFELETKLISQALNIGLQIPLPISGIITEIGLIEFRPVKHLLNYQLKEPSLDVNELRDSGSN